MKIKCITSLAFVLTALPASSTRYDEIQSEVENLIDGDCELSIEAGRAFHTMSNELVNEVNSKVGAILESYDLDCLAGLLSIPGLNIPGFDFNFDIGSFCELARDVLLDGPGSTMSFSNPEDKASFDAVKQTIQQRYLDSEELKKQLRKRND